MHALGEPREPLGDRALEVGPPVPPREVTEHDRLVGEACLALGKILQMQVLEALGARSQIGGEKGALDEQNAG